MRSATTDSRNAQNYPHRNNHSLQNTEEEPKRPQPHPPHTRGTFHRRPQPLYTEKHKVSRSGFLPKTKSMQHSCCHNAAFRSITSQTCTYLRTWQHQMTTIMQPSQCDLQPQLQETHRYTHTGTTTRCRTQRRNQNDPSRTRRTHEVPAAGFVLRLPPQNKAHATFMQPWPCVSQHHVANLHVSTHMATPDDNNHAAIPMRSATTDSRNAQNYPHRNNHSLQNTEEEPKRPQPHPPHTRGTFHRRLQPLYIEKRKVSCSGCLPKQSPCNIHAAITLRFAASRRKPARIYAHGNTRWQQSCSHPNAICNHRFKKRTGIPTQEQPLVAEHRGGTKTTPAAPAAHTRYLSSPAAATYTEKHKVSCSGFLPKTKPHATFMQPLHCVSQHHVANLHVSTHMATLWFGCVSVCPGARVLVDCSCSRLPVCPCARGFLVCPCARGSAACPCARRAVRRPISRISPGHSHFTRKNTRFRAPASSPKQSPCNIHAAITLRFAASRRKPARIYAHGNTRWQQSCSHYTRVLLCDVKSHTTLHWAYFYVMWSLTPQSHTTLHWAYFYVMWSLTPQSHTALHWVYCYVMWSLTPQSHTTLHWAYFYVMWSLTPQSHTTLHWAYCYVMWSLTPQSHTTLHWAYFYVMWSLTPQSHTTLHWVYYYVM